MSLKGADFQAVLKLLINCLDYHHKQNRWEMPGNINIYQQQNSLGETVGLSVAISKSNETEKEVFHARVNLLGEWHPIVFLRGIWLSKIKKIVENYEAENIREFDDSNYFS
jgi:hypothetical protein